MDLLSPEVVADPHPHFRALRESDPVHWSERHSAWLFTRYDDVCSAFRDAAFSSERISEFATDVPGAESSAGPAQRVLANWMEFRDPPDHTRLRRLVQKAFTPRVAEKMRPRIERVVDDLLDDLAQAGSGDLVRSFAFPLPAIVIAEMLGVPAEDRDLFKNWSEDIKGLVFGSPEQTRLERARGGFAEMETYFEDMLERVRRSPDGSLLSALVAAQEADDMLDTGELVGTCVLLLFGGHETTQNLISTGVLVLDRQPEIRAALATQPERLPAAVEELLRYDGPLKLMVRAVCEDREVRGRRIRAGERAFLIQAAANRDPERFPEPDRFDPERADNAHVAFGFGIHFCLGAPLARIEARIALGAILTRFPNLRVQPAAADRPEWQASILGRSLVRLPVDV